MLWKWKPNCHQGADSLFAVQPNKLCCCLLLLACSPSYKLNGEQGSLQQNMVSFSAWYCGWKKNWFLWDEGQSIASASKQPAPHDFRVLQHQEQSSLGTVKWFGKLFLGLYCFFRFNEGQFGCKMWPYLLPSFPRNLQLLPAMFPRSIGGVFPGFYSLPLDKGEKKIPKKNFKEFF